MAGTLPFLPMSALPMRVEGGACLTPPVVEFVPWQAFLLFEFDPTDGSTTHPGDTIRASASELKMTSD